MKTTFVLVCALALVALTVAVAPHKAQPGHIKVQQNIVKGLSVDKVAKLPQAAKVTAVRNALKATHAWCATCVSFFSNVINQLLNIILNVGVIGECSELCGYLPSQVEAEVCNVLCDIAGIEAFIDLIEEVDPDPIYYCEKLNECGINPNAAANITAVMVQPASGPQGTTFEIGVEFQITNEIATGEVNFFIQPPQGQGFGGVELLVDQKPGFYQTGVKFQAQPSEQEPFNPGTYAVTVAVCEGSCGSTHPWSKTLSTKASSFQITNQK